MRAMLGFVVCVGLWTAAYAVSDPVAEVNGRVVRIEEALRTDRAGSVIVRAEGPIEGSPPEIRFRTLAGRLVAAHFSVGHETWKSHATLYFYDDGKPMKYLRSIGGRQDNPERQAIIYAPDGKVLWRNVDAPLVDPTEVQAVYRAIEALRRASARY